jgi:hypothetical protein
LDKDGLAGMHTGQSPTNYLGPYRGDKLSVDHIIQEFVASEPDKVIANLELLPLRMSEGKNNKSTSDKSASPES